MANKKSTNNNEAPLVSVVILTRNRADSLTRALLAVSKLDYPNFEIIVVDNGSTDNTAQVASNFSARYVFSPAKNGFGQSRQLGINAACGEIIAWCDDDCVPVPEWLQHFVRRLQSEEDLGLLGGQVINVGFNEDKQNKGRSRLLGRNGGLAFVADVRDAEFFGNMNIAVRRKAVQSVGGYDPFLKAGREEIDLAMSLRRNGFRVDYEPAAIVKHYHTGVSYKRGRLFYDNHLMRLYFYFKHFRPRCFAEWINFSRQELQLVGNDFYKWLRAFAATILRGNFHRLLNIAIELFNIISARLAIPWLLWRVRKQCLIKNGQLANIHNSFLLLPK